MADWFYVPVMKKLIDACFEYLKDQVKEELQILDENESIIQDVVSAYSQLKNKSEHSDLDKWYWQLRDAVDETDDLLDDLEYRKHEERVSNKTTAEKVVKIFQFAVKNYPDTKKLKEAVQKLSKISSKVSNFRQILDPENQEQNQGPEQQHHQHEQQQEQQEPEQQEQQEPEQQQQEQREQELQEQEQQQDQNPFLSIYTSLPHRLQICFTFCCVFPQHHEFDKDELIRMWIALGFIQSSNFQRETLEETGRKSFNQLVEKSFFEKDETNDNRVCYKMRDLSHAQSVYTQECFNSENHEGLLNSSKTIRHLSIKIDGSSHKAFKKRKFKNLRSLFLSSSDGDEDKNFMDRLSKILKASKSIRLLAIHAPKLRNMPETVGDLHHLRYLKVECDYRFKHPISIKHLYHLQFMTYYKEVQNLEMYSIAIRNFPNLIRLIIDKVIINDPSVLLMEQLRSICSFRFLKIEENDELVSFPSEAEQWFLQPSLSLFLLEFHKLRSLQALPSTLESLSSLDTLRVSNVPQLKLFPNLPASLGTLELHNLESLQCLPSCLSTFSSLKNVILKNIPRLKSLPDLPSSLWNLHLEELENLDFLPSSLPNFLMHLFIIKVPLLLELPDLPHYVALFIFDCHPRLMKLYERYKRR